MKPSIVILDPGHGMSNRRSGVYDPGAVAGGVTEAGIVMDWANELREILRSRKVAVVRTRVNDKDPALVGQRAAIATRYRGDIMLSLHCNAANGTANGTETFYRGEAHRENAVRFNQAVVDALGTRNRGAKTENQSQHTRLAVMSFQPCFLIELGFIDNEQDRAKMLDPALRRRACLALADLLRCRC
jgi:N-acetylmuramoyl-L-alanine amidase